MKKTLALLLILVPGLAWATNAPTISGPSPGEGSFLDWRITVDGSCLNPWTVTWEVGTGVNETYVKLNVPTWFGVSYSQDPSTTHVLPLSDIFAGFKSVPSTVITVKASDSCGGNQSGTVQQSFTYDNTKDIDGDGVNDYLDNCPTIPNNNQADSDSDGVGDVCDNCTDTANPANYAVDYLITNPWATLTGNQRDDDHDGYGNFCDGDFNNSGGLVGTPDLTLFRAANGCNRTGSTCGGDQDACNGSSRCAQFDLNEASTLIGVPDKAIFDTLSGHTVGPKCSTCARTCSAGTSGNCP